MDSVTCITWVRRGVAKEFPDKLQLTKEELKELLKSEEGLKTSILQDEEDKDDSCKEQEESGENGEVIMDEIKEAEKDEDGDTISRYNLDTYDDDDFGGASQLAGLALYNDNKEDPFLTVSDEEDEDEKQDKEDFIIKKNDNLLVVGRIDENGSFLEVYVYNEEDGDLYVHHDIVLPAFPLALEWLGFDSGNLVAVGDMTPLIKIWDLDVVDALETDLNLGESPVMSNSKESVTCNGHSDAVLDLSWNTHISNLLVSGSADTHICLWDLQELKLLSKFSWHQNKVHSLQWHPFEPQILLSSSLDGDLRLSDCRSSDEEYKLWNVNGEIEHVLWNHFNPFYFFCSTEKGFVHCMDSRNDGIVYSWKAHKKEVTGLSLSSQCPGCLITSSQGQMYKVWDVNGNTEKLIATKKLKLGSIYTAKTNPDSPFIVAFGGDDRSNNLKVEDLMKMSECSDHFGEKSLSQQSEDKNAEGFQSVMADQVLKEECDMETCLGVSHSQGHTSWKQTQNNSPVKPKMKSKYQNKRRFM